MRNRKAIPILIVATAMSLWCQPAFTQAQPGTPASESKAERSPAPANQPASDRGKAIQPYRLDFSLNELDGGKKTNSRHYSMDLTAGSANEIKIGTRVPVVTGASEPGAAPNALVNTQWQYVDIGTNIWAHLRESQDDGHDCQLEVRSDVSDIDKGTEAASAATIRQPIIRQMKFNGTTLLVTGRPIVIATMDDPNSSRQFQLEVTATKLR